MFSRIPKEVKIAIMVVCDSLLLPLALWSAISLRLGVVFPDVSGFSSIFAWLPLVTIPILFSLGLYRAVIRYTSEKVIYTVFSGVGLSVVVLAFLVSIVEFSGFPRSALIIYGAFASIYITLSRYLGRVILDRGKSSLNKSSSVAIYGAGRAGIQTALALLSGKDFSPAVFFDDDNEIVGRSILGIRVYSPKAALSVMEEKGCHQLLLAIPSASVSRRKEIIRDFEGKGFVLKTIPGMADLIDGKVRVEDIRDVGVEDLLGRDPIPPVESLLLRCIQGKVVMVTGAGGSIGSELCRQIIKANPKILVLFELNEYALYSIEEELKGSGNNSKVVAVLGDVKDELVVGRVFERFQVETVYHASAYKHVPLIEENAIAGVSNNVLGTRNIALSSIKYSIETFVLVSTDKAVRPTSVMGTSKRLSEMVLQALSQGSYKTKFCMVRFGNVLGSSGSVIPLFKKQIRSGGPVTITHPEVTRYFMTIPEAAQLVIQAGAMGKGGDVYVLDMGDPVKIVDLARRLIEFSGLQVWDPTTNQGDIIIKTVGLRPGEKLYEELLIGDSVEYTEHPRIMTANESFLEKEILWPKLEALDSLCKQGDHYGVLDLLHALVPEYSRDNNVKLEM